MKKYIIITLLLLGVMLAWAQSPVSLRYFTLGSVMDGEWEHIYDPIELSFYDQTYYYTSLSDYTQYMTLYDGEITFTEESRFLSEYPFGFTFRSPFSELVKHALLIRFKDSMLPGFGNMEGETESSSTTYYDLNDDYIYDLRQYNRNRQTNYEDMASKLYLLLNTTVPIGDNVFGVRVSYDSDNQEWDEASTGIDPSGFNGYLDGFAQGDYGEYRYFSTTNLETGLTNIEYSEEGEFETETASDQLDLLVSYMHPTAFWGGNSELRYDLNLSYESANSQETEDSYVGEYYRVIDDNTHETGIYEQTYDREWSMPRAEIFGGIKLRRNIDDAQPRYKQSFTEIGFGLGGFGGPYEYGYNQVMNSEYVYIDTTSVDAQEWETTELVENIDTSGSYMGFHTNLHARSGIFFSEYVCFGYGVSMDLQTFRRESDDAYEYNYVNYNQLGTAFDDIDDVRITTRRSYNYKAELVQTDIQTKLPVGLEFSLPKTSLTDHDSFSLRNFTFRVGTEFTHNIRYSDSRYKLDDTELLNTITEYGDGTITETHQDDNFWWNNMAKGYSSNGFKRFTAGLGYEHSDYLNIDVGGHVDSDGENYFIGAMFTVKR